MQFIKSTLVIALAFALHASACKGIGELCRDGVLDFSCCDGACSNNVVSIYSTITNIKLILIWADSVLIERWWFSNAKFLCSGNTKSGVSFALLIGIGTHLACLVTRGNIILSRRSLSNQYTMCSIYEVSLYNVESVCSSR